MQALRRSAKLWRPFLNVLPTTAATVSTANSSHLHTQRMDTQLLVHKIDRSCISCITRRTASRQHLSRQTQGVKVWEEVSRARAADGTAESFDFGKFPPSISLLALHVLHPVGAVSAEAVCKGMIANLQVNRYTKSSNMTKVGMNSVCVCVCACVCVLRYEHE